MATTQPEGGDAPPGRVVAATVLAVLAAVYLLRYALLPLVFAAAIAYVVRPVVFRFQRHLRLPRIAAVLAVYLLILACISAACWFLVTSLGQAVINLTTDLPGLISTHVERLIGPEIHIFGQTFRSSDAGPKLMDALRPWLSEPSTFAVAGGIVIAAPTVLVLSFVVLFYFINSGGRLAEGVLWLAPPRYRGHLRDLGHRIDPTLRLYVRGVFLVVVYTGLVAWVFLQFVFKVTFAPLIAAAVGLLELIPVVGPAISMVLIGSNGLLHGRGLWYVAASFAFAVALRISIDEAVGPIVLGRAVTLHPMVVIFAFLVGASLFGVLGVFLAVPVAAATKIVLAAWYDEPAK